MLIRKRWLLVIPAIRLMLLSSGCTATRAPARLQHPMLETLESTPHSAPLATVKLPSFSGDPSRRADDAETRAMRQQVAAAARAFVGHTKLSAGGHRLPFDCSGLARAAYLQVGIDLVDVAPREGENATSTIYRYVSQNGVLYQTGPPEVGDLIFFHDTYDLDGNGRRDDGLTHVAIVEEVEPDGTVTMVHRVSRGILRYRMNLRFPDMVKDPATGKRLNHYLRGADADFPAMTTASLFAGYGTVIVHSTAAVPNS